MDKNIRENMQVLEEFCFLYQIHRYCCIFRDFIHPYPAIWFLFLLVFFSLLNHRNPFHFVFRSIYFYLEPTTAILPFTQIWKRINIWLFCCFEYYLLDRMGLQCLLHFESFFCYKNIIQSIFFFFNLKSDDWISNRFFYYYDDNNNNLIFYRYYLIFDHHYCHDNLVFKKLILYIYIYKGYISYVCFFHKIELRRDDCSPFLRFK